MDALSVLQPTSKVFYAQRDITANISPYLESISFIDYIDGQSDELEIAIDDTDDRWIGAWYPRKGDQLSAQIGYLGQRLLPCGDFEIDEIEVNGPPSVVTIKALGAGVKKSHRTRCARAWENTSLQAIAAHIAHRNKLELVGTIRPVQIARATQYQERDLEFLARLSRQYGYRFTIKGKRLVFTEDAALRAQPAVATLHRSELIDYRLRDKISQVFKGARVTWHDPAERKLVEGEAADDGDTSEDVLRVSRRASSPANAKDQASAALADANQDRCGGTVSMPGKPALVAGLVIELAGFGKLNGNYLINSSRHTIERNGGYSTDLELRRAD